MKKPVVLVGMMGSGKTAVGRKVAARLDVPFFDADHAIMDAAHLSIPQIFDQLGEAWFRKKEKEIIAALLSGRPCVLATGGGAILNADTRALIHEKAVAIWLQADVATLLARVSKDTNRPLLKQGNPAETLEKLLAARRDFYAQADIHIDTSHAPFAATVEKILYELGMSERGEG